MILTKLQKTMDDRQLTVEELAAKSLMSARSILNAKRGRGVALNTAKRLAICLRMKLEDLI